MADLAIGVSKTVVQELVKRVRDAKGEEAKQWQTVERDIVFMKHEFEMMQSFLVSAAAAGNGEGRFRAGVGRTWVRQVRELSDGAEDCIDYVLHLDTERSLRTLCLRVLPSCMRGAEVLPLDKAVSDIQQLKAIVEDVSKRNMRYSGLESGDYSGSKPVPVPVSVAGRLELGSSAASASTLLNIFTNPSDAALDKAATECLIGLVAAPDHKDLRIFSVCGTGGDLGGTISIARKAYEDPAFCSEFPLRAWVKLTQPFDPLGFVGSLVDQFEANSQQQPGRTIVVPAAQKLPPEHLVAKFSDDICHMKYLIVLEDVLSMAGWDAARALLPDTDKGSRVIVLTHQLEIASLCTGTKPVQVSPLREFSSHHCVSVFYQELQHTRATDPTREAQASGSGGEQQAMPAAEITEAQASGEQPTKPTAAVITGAQASGKQQVKLATAAEIMEAEASGDRLRSHCSEGFDSQVKKLEELITYSPVRRDEHRVISVCGIAGAGKSSVVATIYDRCLERVTQEKTWDAHYAWVVVPNDPFRIEEFCRRLHWIMKSGPLDVDSASIVSECKMKLYSFWNLIVIDGLKSKADWDLIKTKLALAMYGNCIILLTNDKHVAQDCVADQGDVYNFSDQGDLHRRLQYQCDGDNWMRQRGSSSRLAEAYNWLCSNRLERRDSSEEKKLEKLITSPDRRGKHHVISVCGLPGAGKSFIAKTIYYRSMQLEMLEDLFGEYAWVNVPDPFDIMLFCQRLFGYWTPHVQTAMGQDFVVECSKLMHEKKRFLLVIDGLQSTNDWNSILLRLPLASCISCIVVVTRDVTVARHCATSGDEICLITSLEEDAMRRLIRDRLCEVPGTSEPDPEMTNQVVAIANKCGRSPEVVDALLTLLSKQGAPATRIEALKHLNDNFMKELSDNPDLGKLRTVLFTTMRSNIHDCPQVIKKCIFYLSIFRQGSSIRRDRLVRRWIAEGYSEGIDSISMAVYTETKLFHKLAELGMIAKPAGMSSCQVNSLFLEYITLREAKESIFLPLEVTVLEDGHSPPMTQHVGQHLAIRDWKGEKAVFDCLDLTRLRSLTVSGQWQPFFVSDMMLVLRVLDLEGTSSNLMDGDLKQIVKLLPRLKFLSLRGCEGITRLPRSVGGLRQLQALDVRGTKIVRLPGSIVKLQKLQYLRAGADDGQGGGVRVPGGIGVLKALHTLGAIDLSASCTGVAILNKLHKLQQLRKLHVSGIKRQHNSRCVCVACFVSGGQASSRSSISFPANSFGELKVLEIACSPRMHVQFAEGAVPKLEKVKLYCHYGSSLQFSGLEFLESSLKQILLKGTGCNAVKNELKVQLDQQIPNNQIVPEIAQGHESQPKPILAEGNQQISESNPPAEGNQQISESSQAEGNQQISESNPAEGNQQISELSPVEGNNQ